MKDIILTSAISVLIVISIEIFFKKFSKRKSFEKNFAAYGIFGFILFGFQFLITYIPSDYLKNSSKEGTYLTVYEYEPGKFAYGISHLRVNFDGEISFDGQGFKPNGQRIDTWNTQAASIHKNTLLYSSTGCSELEPSQRKPVMGNAKIDFCGSDGQFSFGKGHFMSDCGKAQIVFDIYKIENENLIHLYDTGRVRKFIDVCENLIIGQHLKNRIKKDKSVPTQEYMTFDPNRKEIPRY